MIYKKKIIEKCFALVSVEYENNFYYVLMTYIMFLDK